MRESEGRGHGWSGPPAARPAGARPASARPRFLIAALAVMAVALVWGVLAVHDRSVTGSHGAAPGTRASMPGEAGPGCGRTFTWKARSWPDCATTGVPTGIHLRPLSGNLTIRKNGTVIDHVSLKGGIDIYANNVTIEDSYILSTGYLGISQRAGHSGLKVLHDTITGDAGHGPDSGGEDIGVWTAGTDVTIAYNNISGFGGNVAATGDVHDNYLHGEQAFGSTGIGGCDPLPHPIGRCYNHSDAFGIDSGRGITLRHNTILESPIPGGNSAVELDNDLGSISDVTVADNFLAGGNYCAYAGSRPGAAPSERIVFTGNAFSSMYYRDCGQFGPVAYWNPAGMGNVWAGNYWADGPLAGHPIRPPAS